LTKPVNRWSKVSIGAISMGQEIGISPLQLAVMVSTIANDGVMVPPRVVAATMEPRRTPQQFVFEPVSQRRVISTLTAAQMKQMLAGVVLEGTGKKALLSGYSSAGKTGTAQKADPATGGYSKTKYIASFAGFAPVNNPAVTVAVILDSPVGPHQGGQVAAPVFQRITQQVLGYLNVPHDVPVPTTQQLLLAARRTKAEDLAEGSPDRLGTLPELMEAENTETTIPASAYAQPAGKLLHAALVERERPTALIASVPPPVVPAPLPKSGTVVLDVEQGGVVVPSFLGMHLRGAVELAEESSLELEAVGSGAASGQSPAAGSHVPAGTRITVRFAR
jgi:cell division protein FtsI (penicillin-binding protein 3)